MAMVVVIIGILSGSTMVARSLIRGSQLQSILVNTDRYLKALKQFKNKYYYFPGDQHLGGR